MEILLVIVWLALCAVVGFYAEGKGRSGVGIFFLSLFLSPLVGFIAALAMQPDEKKVASARGKKKCPECAEFVQPDAKICRFCQHKFTEEEERKTEAEQLAAAGVQAGPPCPKCGSVRTYRVGSVTKASRWWKQLNTGCLHCHKCSEEWPDGSVPQETVKSSVGITLILAVCTALLVLVAETVKPPQATKHVPVSVAPVSPASVAGPKNWSIDQSTNSLDNVKTTVIRNDGGGGSSIIIRFRGKSLDIYVVTPEMVDNEDQSVRLRFDNGEPSRQVWSRSDDYSALFSSNPRWLLNKLRTAKKFYIEYHPYEKVPETLEFEVVGLAVPKTLLSAYDRKLRQDRDARQKASQAAWQEAFDACMEAQNADPTSGTTQTEKKDECKRIVNAEMK